MKTILLLPLFIIETGCSSNLWLKTRCVLYKYRLLKEVSKGRRLFKAPLKNVWNNEAFSCPPCVQPSISPKRVKTNTSESQFCIYSEVKETGIFLHVHFSFSPSSCVIQTQINDRKVHQTIFVNVR